MSSARELHALRAPAPPRPSRAGRNSSTAGLRASRGHHDEPLRLRRFGGACKGEHVVEVDLAECLLASRPASGWCRGSRTRRDTVCPSAASRACRTARCGWRDGGARGRAGVAKWRIRGRSLVHPAELSRTYPPTRPLAPASRATRGSLESSHGQALDCSFSATSLARTTGRAR